MPKRKRSSTTYTYKKRRYAKKPRRAYSNSMVPLRSGGYKPNNVERKVFNRASATFQINTTGNIVYLCLPTLGTDMTNRIGRKIMLKSVYVRGYVAQEASSTIASAGSACQLARCIILVDYQPNGSYPAITDILDTATSTSQLNLDNRDRFKILVDKQYSIDPYVYSTTATQAVACFSGTIKPVKIFKKINIEQIYNVTNGGTVADINTGNLLMCWIGTGVAGTNVDLNFIGSTRVRFVDA